MTEAFTGTVTDFKRFAVHDGDGIRTTVFLKGCPLKCVWCHNPESISPKPQLALYAEKCVGCRECEKVCPNGAHIFGESSHCIDREKCVSCGKCEAVCAAGALKLHGRTMTVDEVIRVVAEDRMFYETSDGGMTISGGEPTMQPGFTLALLKAAKAEGIGTALDTCGFAVWETYAAMLPYADTFLFDVKHITEEGHIRCTSRPNGVILENLHKLSANGARIEIRTPLVPGYNDDPETLEGIASLLAPDGKPLDGLTKVKLLPYHAYARSKYHSLDMEDTMPDVARPTAAHMEECAAVLRGHGLTVVTE